ncbi:MAG: hypothetical protein Q9167_007070 [Letrouitia subvulpina]
MTRTTGYARLMSGDIELQLAKQFSGIELSHEKRPVVRKYPRGLNHIARGSLMARDVLKNPKRLQWVAFDRAVFTKMLIRLAELNDRLYEMMHDQQARLLEAVTQKTYLEMLPGDCQHMSLRDHYVRTKDYDEQFLVSLADFKTLNTRTSDQLNQQPPSYDSAIAPTQLECSQIDYPNTTADDSLSISRLRTEALLQSDKPDDLYTPRCPGYFDVRGNSDRNGHPDRFGLVFEISTDS